MTDSTFWLLITFFWTLVLSFYSMQEMACISCNKLRVDYAAAQKKHWAIWLQRLLESPQLLFSTTLIGVNVAMMMSSESSRRLFEAWGFDPNLAPIVEIPFLLIFGELIPMFAARLYPEHASRLGITILYASAKILSPITTCISYFFKHSKKQHHAPFLSRDELQRLLEEHQAGYLGEHSTPENDFIANIFTLREMQASHLMQKLEQVICLPSNATVGQVREIVKKSRQSVFPVFHRLRNKVIGLLHIPELLNETDNKKIDDFTQSVIFVPQNLSALEVINKLQDESSLSAIVINQQGEAKGIIFLDDLIDELFGSENKKETSDLRYLEKTISADTNIVDFNTTYDTDIDPLDCKTFAELIEKSLGRHPHVNDILLLDPFELVVKETSLFKAKTVQVRSKTP